MLITIVALSALLLAYLALVGAWLALRTLGRVRRASAVLGRNVVGEQSLLEAMAAHAELVEALGARVSGLETELASTRRAAAAGQRSGSRDVGEAIAALRTDLNRALRRLALVRFDAFGDGQYSGRLSFSLAMLDDAGNGVTLTSIAGRSESRLYAKGISGGAGEQELSPEEQQAVRAALAPVTAAQAS